MGRIILVCFVALGLCKTRHYDAGASMMSRVATFLPGDENFSCKTQTPALVFHEIFEIGGSCNTEIQLLFQSVIGGGGLGKIGSEIIHAGNEAK